MISPCMLVVKILPFAEETVCSKVSVALVTRVINVTAVIYVHTFVNVNYIHK